MAVSWGRLKNNTINKPKTLTMIKLNKQTPEPQLRQTAVISRFLWFLKKRRWSKYEHVMFVQDFRGGINNFEILRRKCEVTGLTQYKRIYIKGCVHNLTSRLSQWYATQNGL